MISDHRPKKRPPTPMARPARDPDTSTYTGRFALRLRELREKRGKTVPEMVDAFRLQGLTVAAPTIYGWERGIRTPDFDSLPQIAAAYGVTVRSLIPAE